MDKLNITPSCRGDNPGVGDFSSAFSGSEKDHVPFLQIMDGHFFPYLTLVSRSPGQIHPGTLEGKVHQCGAIDSRTGRAAISIGGSSKRLSGFYHLIDVLAPDLSGGRTRGEMDDNKEERKIKKRLFIKFANANTHMIT